jgi:outer membrane protein assembly factor BamE (lipoprotein component of BamABCDE complex)
MRYFGKYVSAMVIVFLLGATIICSPGCATVGRKIDVSAVDRIQKGKTTRQEVLNWLGSPDHVRRDGDGIVTYSYMYVRSEVKGESFIPYAGVFVGGSETESQSVTVTFGPDGIVKDFTSDMGGMETNQNLGAGDRANNPETEGNKRPK